MDTRTQHVVILGGGYAGQMAAARLARQGAGLRVTVVDARDVFVERIRLHQAAAGQTLRRRQMTDLLPRGVAFRQARVLGHDPLQQQVSLATLAGREELGYDWLVLALGSRVDTAAVPGVAAHALTLDGSNTVVERLAALRATHPSPRVLVVGGGLTGIETATELAERWPTARVELVTAGELGQGFAPRAQAYLRQVCDQLGIVVHEDARVAALDAGAAHLATGETLPFDACVWLAGMAAPPLARQAGLPVNRLGQVLTDPCLRAQGYPNVFAIGDAAEASGAQSVPLRMACATAMPMGAYVGGAIGRLARGEAVEPFRFGYILLCVSLGRRRGLVQTLHPDDTPTGRVFTGRVGARIKEAVCRMTVDAIGLERRGLLALWWPQPARREIHGAARPATREAAQA